MATSWWARAALTVAILGWLASRIDMTAAGRAVVSVSPTHLAAVLALVAVDRLVMIWRWVLLLRARGVEVAATEAARVFLVSSFVGSFLPAGIGGDAARAWSLAQITTRAGEALASVVVDRLLGLLSLAAMGLAGVALWSPGGVSGGRVAAGVAILTLACAAAFWSDGLLRAAVPAHRHGGAVTRRVLRLADAVAAYRDHRGALAVVMAWSLAVQVLRITQAWLLGLGLGLQVPFAYYLLVMPLGLLMLLLPVSVSGFGVPQGVIVWLLRPMGVADSVAFALSTLVVLTGLAGNLPGLWLWLRRRETAGAAARR
ncbi:MAG: lysylphosphatidylglycerol synthase transmembrane domain-containing protein [Vicinamibacterales bacterium]